MENRMDYETAMSELFGLAQSGKLPEPVFRALLSLLANPAKLLCAELEVCGTLRTSAPDTRLQASDLLVKLVQAVRTLDWEFVVVAGEQHSNTPQPAAT